MRRFLSNCRRNSQRRGVVAVVVMVTLLVLLGCLSLGVDVGYICDLCASMQSAVDATALAGASGLSRVPQSSRTRAEQFAALNEVAGSGLRPAELTMTVGHWMGLTNTFVPDDGAIHSTPNALRVYATRSNIPLFFAAVLGENSTTVTRMATAVQGSGRCLGIWGVEGITGSGDVITDSYVINEGNYGGNDSYGGVNIRSNGDICTCGDMLLGGDTSIHGDAIYGEGENLQLNGTSYEIYGRVDDQECNLSPPTFDMEYAEENNDNLLIPLTNNGNAAYNPGSGRLFLTGNDVLVLLPGTYYFTSIMIESLAELRIIGPTEIYVSGNITVGGGGVINTTNDPRNLIIYCTGTMINFNGGSDFYGVIIAPQTDINFLGESSYFGMIVGETLDFRGTTNMHVEESVVMDIFGISPVEPMLVE